MTLVTAVMTLTVLSGCGSDSDPGEVTAPTSTPAPTLSEAPPVDADEPAAVALRGDWEIPSEQYVLHLIEDGTFVEDFQGVEDFLTGKYSVDGDTISLVGDDGNTSEGKIVGETLELPLGTATRVE